MKVIVDPRSSILYGSFYIYALILRFGRRAIRFDARPFASLPEIGFNLRFIIQDGINQTRYFIYTDDWYILNEEMYEWCDVYGSVNANFEHYPKEQYPKIVSLAPSFGIRCFSLPETLYLSIANLFKSWNFVVKRSVYNKYSGAYECNKVSNVKRYVFDYLKCYFKRRPYEEYTHSKSSDNYVFFLSTLWYNNEFNRNDEGVNYRRSLFIRACKLIGGLNFEGGLLGDDSSSKALFGDVLATEKVPMKEWMEKTKTSTVVFNTPAFWNCHGWKLGEYLALGKCIISTELQNSLPEPLSNGENIIFVKNDEDSMTDAIERVLEDVELRKKIEDGAREYWNQYCSPRVSLSLLGIE